MADDEEKNPEEEPAEPPPRAHDAQSAPISLFDKVQELLEGYRLAVENDQVEFFPEIEQCMDEVVKMAKLMEEQEKKIRQEFGIKEDTWAAAMKQKDKIGKRALRFVEQIEDLKNELKTEQNKLQKELGKSSGISEQKRKRKKTKKGKSREHKKKFRGLGGDDWKKL